VTATVTVTASASASVTATATAGSGAPRSTLAERRVFRRIETGLLPARSTRETWVLERTGTAQVLAIRVDQAGSGRLDGSEHSPQRWKLAAEGTYLAAAAAGVARFRLASYMEVAADGVSRDTRLPAEIEMSCRPSTVGVLAAGSVLLHGDACGDSSSPAPRWRPARRSRIAVEECACESVGGDLVFESAVFAEGTGLEWVFENSDCMAQEGAFRRLTPEPAATAGPDRTNRSRPAAPRPSAPSSPTAAVR
jgi:hypothetical protein